MICLGKAKGGLECTMLFKAQSPETDTGTTSPLPDPDTVLQVTARVQTPPSEQLCLSAALFLSEANCSHFCQAATHTPTQWLPQATGFLCPMNFQPGYQLGVVSVIQQHLLTPASLSLCQLCGLSGAWELPVGKHHTYRCCSVSSRADQIWFLMVLGPLKCSKSVNPKLLPPVITLFRADPRKTDRPCSS